jgi:hypothetical protein
MDWRQILEVVSTLFAMAMSIYAVVRSSKQKASDEMERIKTMLSDHILEDSHSITTLNVKVENLEGMVKDKLDQILEQLK